MKFYLKNYSEQDKSEKERLNPPDEFVPKISERSKMFSVRKRIKTSRAESIHDALHKEKITKAERREQLSVDSRKQFNQVAK